MSHLTPRLCEAVWAYQEGVYVAALCAATLTNPSTLYRLLRRLGVPLRAAHPPLRGVRVYYEDGSVCAESIAAAARLLGCTWNTLKRRTKAYAGGVQLASPSDETREAR